MSGTAKFIPFSAYTNLSQSTFWRVIVNGKCFYRISDLWLLKAFRERSSRDEDFSNHSDMFDQQFDALDDELRVPFQLT